MSFLVLLLFSFVVRNVYGLTEMELLSYTEYRISRTLRDVIVVLWTLIFLMLTIYKFYCIVNDANIKIIQYVSLIFLTFICISFTFRGIEFLTQILLLSTGFYIFLELGLSSLYLLILLRLYYTFKETEYRLSKCVIITHIITLISANILFIISAIFDYYDIYPFNFIAISLAAFIFIFGLFHLSYYFTHSLFLFLVKMDENKCGTLGMKQKVYLRTIVKQTLLANIINLAGFLWAILSVLLSLIDPNRKSVALVMIRSHLMGIILYTIITCIYLSFTINNATYYKLCGFCHNKCYDICKSKASKRILKQNANKYNIAVTFESKELAISNTCNQTQDTSNDTINMNQHKYTPQSTQDIDDEISNGISRTNTLDIDELDKVLEEMNERWTSTPL